MCGRYTLKNVKKAEQLALKLTGERMASLRPRYNVAPSQTNPVVRADDTGKPILAAMKWGLVPFWEKSEKPKFSPIN